MSAQYIDYADYLRSDAWKKTRKKALRRGGEKCQVCSTDTHLEVHHNTYENLGYEKPTDLVVLCRDCHSIYHQKGRLPEHEEIVLNRCENKIYMLTITPNSKTGLEEFFTNLRQMRKVLNSFTGRDSYVIRGLSFLDEDIRGVTSYSSFMINQLRYISSEIDIVVSNLDENLAYVGRYEEYETR